MLAANQFGAHGATMRSYGDSMIIDPWGKVMAMLDHDEPGVIVADLDLKQVAAARGKIPAWAGGRDFTGP